MFHSSPLRIIYQSIWLTRTCRAAHTPHGPDLKQDLFEVYSLLDLAKSVARWNPDGSKAVKLRKSYRSHLKKHVLPGDFGEIKKEIDAPDSLYAMMMEPEEEWDAQYARGKDISKGLSEDTVASLPKATIMARGIIPKSAFNPSVLGDMQQTGPAEPSKIMQNGNKTPIPQNPSIVRTAKAELPRPKRNVKKRTYGDSSFEGYGEGYVDDDGQEAGYSTGDGDDRSGSRKRPKKVGSMLYLQGFMTDTDKSTQSHGFQGAPMRQNSYGPGMVGA